MSQAIEASSQKAATALPPLTREALLLMGLRCCFWVNLVSITRNETLAKFASAPTTRRKLLALSTVKKILPVQDLS